MSVLSLKEIKLKKTQQRLMEPIIFDLVMDCSHEISDDIEFTIVYSGHPETDKYDQVICNELIGPIPQGRIGFSLETTPPVVENIAEDQLFGVTSVILIGKYRGRQFIRIGYFVRVEYPGIPLEELTDYGNIKEDEIDEDDDEITEEDEGGNEIIEESENNVQVNEGDNDDDEINEEYKEEDEDEKEEDDDNDEDDEINEEYKEEDEDEKEDDDEDDEINEEEDEIIYNTVKIVDKTNSDLIEIYGKTINKNLIEISLAEPALITEFLISWNDSEGDYTIEMDEDVNEGIINKNTEKVLEETKESIGKMNEEVSEKKNEMEENISGNNPKRQKTN
ncbi:Histone chaperone ASF1 [Astathelohania contejeani]|uniref:Anti-silencing function protein 1 n=1 Tax=Astathelohania contejeani TaxID=164912 RepID=A0ABQ7HZR2_9MICR|nr:Histone chaperone ASF1 [Thelohania contejeani]